MTKSKQEGPSEYKTFPAFELKYDEDQGLVEHIITLFGVIDHGLDRSHPGCFKKTLLERGGKIRVLDMHKTDSVMCIVGKPLEIREIGRDELPAKVLEQYPEATGGLWAKTKFFLDTPEGKGAFIRIKEDTIDWSYGYDALDTDESTVKLDGEDVDIRDLRQLRLHEYGPVLFGMVPGTTTLSAKADDPADAKADPSPSEFKPEPEVTENTIRIRVRNPDDFEDDSFRTINIGASTQDIKATVGRLKGENTMTVQSYVFDKEKWTVEDAQAWVDEHKKDDVPEIEEKQATEEDTEADTSTEDDTKEVEGGKADASAEEQETSTEIEVKNINLSERIQAVHQAFNNQYNPAYGPWMYWPGPVYDEYVMVQYDRHDGVEQWFQVPYTIAEDGGVDFAPRGEWQEGDYVFTPKAEKAAQTRDMLEAFLDHANAVLNPDTKAGRMLNARNVQRLVQSLSSLISVLEDAGIDIPGIGEKPEPETENEEEGKDYSLEIETAAAELDLFELEY